MPLLRLLICIVALGCLSACSSLSEFANASTLHSSERLVGIGPSSGSIVAWVDVEERQNVHTGMPFIEFKAYNHSNQSVCARAYADVISTSGGYRFGSWHVLAPGTNMVVGYINDYHDVRDMEADMKAADAAGNC